MLKTSILVQARLPALKIMSERGRVNDYFSFFSSSPSPRFGTELATLEHALPLYFIVALAQGLLALTIEELVIVDKEVQI